MSNEGPARDEPLLTAAKHLAWRSRQSGVTPSLPAAAILTHQGSLLPKHRPWNRDRRTSPYSFDSYLLEGGAVVLAAVRGVGAPATAIAIEELSASGVRRLIAVDIGGSIDPAVRGTDAVLIDAALACDGTSPHYTPDRLLEANEPLTERLATQLTTEGIVFTRGRAWSTDAVYRELPSQLEAARRDGAVIADMETASVFAVAANLGIDAAAVLVAADEMHDGWQPPVSMAAVQRRLRAVLTVAIASLLP